MCKCVTFQPNYEPISSPEGEPSVTLSCRRRGEHPEARKHRWVRCFGVRSRKLVRYAARRAAAAAALLREDVLDVTISEYRSANRSRNACSAGQPRARVCSRDSGPTPSPGIKDWQRNRTQGDNASICCGEGDDTAGLRGESRSAPTPNPTTTCSGGPRSSRG
jgi:hypothetical protein